MGNRHGGYQRLRDDDDDSQNLEWLQPGQEEGVRKESNQKQPQEQGKKHEKKVERTRQEQN